MQTERWARLKSLFSAALHNDANGRKEFAAIACVGDTSLERDLNSLLRHHSDEGDILDRQLPAVKAVHEFPPGAILCGRFEILRLLGTGGMGSVFEARDLLSSEVVALKALHPTFALNPQFTQRFRREVQLARRITHRNICRTNDLFRHEEDGLTVELISMEMLQGETLYEYLKRIDGPIPPDVAIAWARQVADGLAAAHEAGIIHRDLKPANLMIVGDRIVITDFGLAQLTVPEENPATLLAGTPAYMAPEQFQGRPAGVASDIYSLGIVLCEMLTRSRTPSAANSLGQWSDVICKCTEPDPRNRYGSMRALLSHLGPRRPYRWIAAALVIAGLCGAAWWLYARFSPYQPPASAYRWYERGINAMAGGAHAIAATEFQEAVRLAGDFPLAHARLAFALSLQDYGQRAREEMKIATKLIERTTLSSAARREADAISQALQGHPAEAATRFRALAATGSQYRIPRLLDAGLMAEVSEQSKLAQELYRSILKEEPDSAAANLRLAIVQARQGDSVAAESSFKSAAGLYRKMGDAIGYSEAMLASATFLARQNRVPEALERLSVAREFARAADNPHQQVRVLLQTAVLRRMQSDAAGSAALAEEALRLARQEDMQGILAQGLLDLGNAHLRARDYESAARCFEQALVDAKRMDSQRRQNQALASLASVRSQQHRPAEARALLDQAIPFYRAGGYRRELSQTLALQAGVLLMLGDLKDIPAIVHEQVALAESTRNAVEIGRAKSRAGSILLRLERFADAEALLLDAEAKLANSEDATIPALAVINRATALWRMGRYPEAEQALQKSEWLQRKAQESGQVAHRRELVRAEMLMSRGRWASAAVAAKAALESASKTNPIERLQADLDLTLANAALRRSRASIPEQPPTSELLSDVFFRLSWRISAAEERILAKSHAEASRIIGPALQDAVRYGLPESSWKACAIGAAANGSSVAQDCQPYLRQVQSVLTSSFEAFLARPDVQIRNSK